MIGLPHGKLIRARLRIVKKGVYDSASVRSAAQGDFQSIYTLLVNK